MYVCMYAYKYLTVISVFAAFGYAFRKRLPQVLTPQTNNCLQTSIPMYLHVSENVNEMLLIKTHVHSHTHTYTQ